MAASAAFFAITSEAGVLMGYGNKRLSVKIAALAFSSVWLPRAMAQTVASWPDGPVACDAFQRVGNGS
jgi:hypothetical protein